MITSAEKPSGYVCISQHLQNDLKGPIVTIQGFTRALKEDFGSSLTAQADTYLTYMDDAARKMMQLTTTKSFITRA